MCAAKIECVDKGKCMIHKLASPVVMKEATGIFLSDYLKRNKTSSSYSSK